jgi:hypothetical protein
VVEGFAEDGPDAGGAANYEVMLHTFPRPGQVAAEPPGEPGGGS